MLVLHLEWHPIATVAYFNEVKGLVDRSLGVERVSGIDLS